MTRVRLAYINTHAGQALRQGGVRWVKQQFDPDLVVLVEVGRLAAQARARSVFAPRAWSGTGFLPRRPMVVESGTLIFAKRTVLKRKWSSNQFLTGQRFLNGRRDKWHPVRRATRAFYVLTKSPGVRLHVGARHAWTHAGFPLNSDHPVPTEYRKQIHRFANDAGDSVTQGAAVVEVGDMNALPDDGDFVERTYRDQGLELLLRRHLDFLFGSPKVRVVHHEWVPAGLVHTDHPGLVVDLEVD